VTEGSPPTKVYAYRKIYADLLGPGGEVCVLYLHQVCIAGRWVRRASVEWTGTDGSRRVGQAVDEPPAFDADTPLSALPVRLELGGSPATLHLEQEQGAGSSPQPSPAVLDDAGQGSVPLAEGLLRLRPERLLHQGDAFAADRVPRRLDRWTCRVVGGPTWERRWLGEGQLGEHRGPALYEEVRFGPAAAALARAASSAAS